jgi:nitrite reductase/ring-hydroxylating ferredoxin subunit
MPRVDVGALADFDDGQIRVIEVNGREIGIARRRDALYALRNLCPHQAGPICAGRMLAGITSKSTVGHFDVDADAPVVACAWHGWEFSMQTGESIPDPTLRVRTYDVQIEDGRVLVEMGGRRVV